MATTAHPALLAAKITLHLHPDMSRAILADPRWVETAATICARYGPDIDLMAQNMEHLAHRLDASPGNAPWIARNTYSPASWLSSNLTPTREGE